MAEITITGLDKLVKSLGTDLDEPLQGASLAIAAEAQDRIAPYPPQTGKKQPFKSARQRRGFFARLRSGAIQVPYHRGSSPGSETLGRRWNIRPLSRFGAVLENRSSYAGLVHGAKTQAGYHQGNWKTDEGIAEEIQQDGTAQRVIEQAMMKFFNR